MWDITPFLHAGKFGIKEERGLGGELPLFPLPLSRQSPMRVNAVYTFTVYISSPCVSITNLEYILLHQHTLPHSPSATCMIHCRRSPCKLGIKAKPAVFNGSECHNNSFWVLFVPLPPPCVGASPRRVSFFMAPFVKTVAVFAGRTIV